MSGHERRPLVPRLRFPEFRDAGEWITVELGKLSRLLTERVGSTTCTPYTIISGVGLISQEEKLGRTIAGNSLKNYLVLQYNDFAYNKSATKAYPQGFIALYTGDERAAVPNSIFTCFRVNQNQAIPTFLDALFTSNLHGKWLRARIAVGARAHGSLQVSDDDLMTTPVPLPNGTSSLEEQQKIADSLSSLDDLIAAETQKLDTLKTHKKGLMQQLFPREGETVPRLRFPEFRDAREWKESNLGELTSIVRGGSPRPIDDFLTSAADGLNWLKIGDVDRDAKYIISTEEKVRAEALSKTRVIQPGDFILSNSMSFGRPYISTIQTCIHDGWIAVTKIPASLNSDFLYYALLSERSQKYFFDQAAGSGVQNLNKDIIKTLVLGFPEVKEQQCIADCLSFLDDFINAQTQKIEALKTQKKGLMQQLFPTLDEVDA
ncbi:restriction endonuclease subunit S [Pseudomonas aeruginosa]|uniref:restriction endonuclease subunit S n=1 Tax=Pseudomonas aeruginosa TaxID=287 RepID=UPI00085955AD|nr:restriction endonuclease subunit S [Pseudomonas aeruginosa]MCT4806263.1 restriction endonuclease subunit S [Pseudomonas aeruginosa]MCT4816558.1 restriction endonuclease subunit S [Pseudomonas aeruginosa]MCT4818987.1 restriction endonuclease subunit S [Pseudomonas aeruginosa]MCT4829803.1 restriction endonuclease subunit S [Pseudomonas aeruginosa]MCT4848892.1 restriction endonuclease subunit S [Pseudomonas aeruginosa]